MRPEIEDFWLWFRGFADRLPVADSHPEELLDELLVRLHALDERIFFEVSTNGAVKELILTAQGEVDVFPIVDEVVAAAPSLDGWAFFSLKPPMGFRFVFSNNGLVVNVAELWFLPLRSPSQPSLLGLRLGVPDAEAWFETQTVDAAYTILESGLGERAMAVNIQHVEVEDLPDDPAGSGYIELPELSGYVAWHNSRQAKI